MHGPVFVAYPFVVAWGNKGVFLIFFLPSSLQVYCYETIHCDVLCTDGSSQEFDSFVATLKRSSCYRLSLGKCTFQLGL